MVTQTNGILKPEIYKIKIKSLFSLSVKFNHCEKCNSTARELNQNSNTTYNKMKRKLKKECDGCDLVNVSRWSGIGGATLVHEDRCRSDSKLVYGIAKIGVRI